MLTPLYRRPQVIPAKYAQADISALDRYFAMGRGRQRGEVDLPAQEMQKWFDSNYHCASLSPR
jgi:5-methyltetrahydropteroyltriglutamate--homocysteine methyltransferase